MSRWLLGRDEAFDEPDFPISTDAELQCTRSGQVLTEFQGASVFDLNRDTRAGTATRRERRRSATNLWKLFCRGEEAAGGARVEGWAGAGERLECTVAGALLAGARS